MNDSFDAEIWPTEIRVQSAIKALEIDFDSGDSFSIPAELLRVESPSAEVQGHVPSQKKLVAGRAHVNIIGMEAIVNYAVKITFDDLHDTGIYTWRYLHKLGSEKEHIWKRYLAELEAAGLSREP